MRQVYMDHAATTPMDKEVVEEMVQYFDKKFGNPSSLHSFGREAKIALDTSRRRIAKVINADESEIIFTSGGTESDNLALVGTAFANRKKGKHIITSRIEHKAVLNTCTFLERQGFDVTYLDVDEHGFVNPEDVENAIKDDTILVSVMHANNEIGTIEPIEKIGAICRERGVYFHTDAVQSFGKVPIDVNKMNIDMLSVSSHKIYGPKGTGCLYVRKGIKIDPLIHGGSQEFGKRAGTENIAAIVGFGKAAEISRKRMTEESEHLTQLRNVLVKNVLKEIPNSYLNGHPEKRLPGNAHFRFDFIEGEALLLKLDMEGVAASSGSACSSKTLRPSHVLLAIGLKPEEAHGSVRLTLGRSSTKEDVEYVTEKLKSAVSDLRQISPLGKPE